MHTTTPTVVNFYRVLSDWDWDKNDDAPENYPARSNEKVWWKCHKCKHNWQAIIYNRVGSGEKKGTNCPKCQSMSERKRLDSIPELFAEYSELNKKPASEIRLSSRAASIWECPEKGCLWKCSVKERLLQGTTCKVCSGDYVPLYISHPEVFHEIVWNKTEVPVYVIHPEFVAAGSKMRATWSCKTCKHEWEASVVNRTRIGTGCPKCHKRNHAVKQRLRTVAKNGSVADYPDIMQEWDFEKNVDIIPEEVPATWTKKAWWKCVAGHSWQSKVGHRVERGWRCPRCAAIESVNNYYKERTQTEGSVAENRPALLLEWNWDKNTLNPYELLIASHRKAHWVCSQCQHEWEAAIANRARGSETGCPQCALKIWVSKGEEDLANFVKTLTHNVKTSDRTVIAPHELDIYLPDLQIAIEFNGDYWHSEKIIQERFNTSPYEHHFKKVQRCRDAGVALLYVWESDWNMSRSLMEDVLRTALNGGVVHPVLLRLQ